jgi:hypothetical protein
MSAQDKNCMEYIKECIFFPLQSRHKAQMRGIVEAELEKLVAASGWPNVMVGCFPLLRQAMVKLRRQWLASEFLPS